MQDNFFTFIAASGYIISSNGGGEVEGGRAGEDSDGGKQGRTKDKDRVGGKIVFDKDWLYSCPKNFLLTTEKNDSVVHVFSSSSNKSLQDTKETIFNVS